MSFNILIADDDETFSDEDLQFQPALLRALAEFGIDSVDVEFVRTTRLPESIAVLNDSSRVIHLAFIDIYWPIVGQRGQYQNQPAAKELLQKALLRPETAVILLSSESLDLLKYFYDRSQFLYRPHAVLDKLQAHDVDILFGTLDSAFSQARLPLRSMSRVIGPATVADRSPHRAVVNGKVINELICIIAPDLVSAEYSVVSGGLSGTYIYVVEGQKINSRTGTLMSDAFVLKVAQDRKELLDEMRNHREYVRSFPQNRFARVLSDIISFAGWSALAFDIAPGSTAASAGNRLFSERAWVEVFSPELVGVYLNNGTATNDAFVEWLTGKYGLLYPTRWERLIDEARSIGATPELLGRLECGPTELFHEEKRQTWLSVMHGDLHTRNVLLTARDAAIWVDAASIRERGLWCEDLARFSVWCACGSIDLHASVSRNSKALNAALSYAAIRRNTATWPALLNARIQSTLELFRDGFEERKVVVHMDRDWTAIYRAELLRAAYSVDMFSPTVRLAALEAVASS